MSNDTIMHRHALACAQLTAALEEMDDRNKTLVIVKAKNILLQEQLETAQQENETLRTQVEALVAAQAASAAALLSEEIPDESVLPETG